MSTFWFQVTANLKAGHFVKAIRQATIRKSYNTIILIYILPKYSYIL